MCTSHRLFADDVPSHVRLFAEDVPSHVRVSAPGLMVAQCHLMISVIVGLDERQLRAGSPGLQYD